MEWRPRRFTGMGRMARPRQKLSRVGALWQGAGMVRLSHPSLQPARGVAKVRRLVAEHAWLGVALGAALVFAGAVDFEPPAQVRVDGGAVSEVVGDAPLQEFTNQGGHAQAVQLRAVLRRYRDPNLDVLVPSPESEAAAQLLSSPVVTTLFGMQATIEQTVKLPGTQRELDVTIKATPRTRGRQRRGKGPTITVDHELSVRSRYAPRWFGEVQHRTHLREQGRLMELHKRPYRVVFLVDEELFSLDLEIDGD